MALTAALLGWMFDGFEMGMFPLAGRPALATLLGTSSDAVIGPWFGVSMAVFLVGAATGGVVFGWLGDRIGRVRSMMLSVLAYSVFTGLGAASQEVWHLIVLRFLAALGMGGEWSLGVALVNEIWPGKSRAFLAGLIGAAANVGFLLIAFVNIFVPQGPESWRTLMLICAVPALLTFFIRVFVPESARWEKERSAGATTHWSTVDLLWVLFGAAGACLIISLWAVELDTAIRIHGTVVGLAVATLGFLFPVKHYLERSAIAGGALAADIGRSWKPTITIMLIGACLSGVALLGTWGSLQWAVAWVGQLTSQGHDSGITAYPKEWTQMVLAVGAIVGTILAALAGDWLGRRLTYFVLCIGSLASVVALYQLNTEFGLPLLFWAFVAGGITASFYGWLPLYLPELFPTRIRATGQGFSFNFGRIIAAVGALQTGALMAFFGGDYPQAASVMGLIYLVGVIIIWLAPETRGKPLPE
jgi:MFS family permease